MAQVTAILNLLSEFPSQNLFYENTALYSYLYFTDNKNYPTFSFIAITQHTEPILLWSKPRIAKHYPAVSKEQLGTTLSAKNQPSLATTTHNSPEVTAIDL
jgi:hypothetical protein